MRKPRMVLRVVCLASVLALLLGYLSAQNQDFKARSVSVPAPGVVTTPLAARALPPPDPLAEVNAREARLRDHHLPLPIVETPPSAALAVPPPAAATSTSVAASVAATSLGFVTNRPLSDVATNNMTSTVSEPSVAARGQEILVTGNWFAAFSTDGGATFSYVNPATTFPAIPNQPFCCDQVALYDAQHDLMVWFLQYVDDGTRNTGRLAVANGNDIRTQQWRFYDFTPQGVGNWNNEWFDYPDMAVGEKYLYITTNMFTTVTDTFTRSLILRIPLDKLAAYQSFNLDFFDTNQAFSLRPTQGATSTMYFGSNIATTRIRVLTWPENSTTISSNDVSVQLWSNATRVAPGPDNRDWLGRADGRITAAWLSGNEIGFGWTAAQDSNFPFPHVRVAVMNKDTKALTGQPHLWSSSVAYAYPAAAPNSDGKVGISVHFGGGGQYYPSHAVGVLNPSTSSWELVNTATGTHGPASNRWGDYLAIRPHGANQQTWAATGFTLQGGSAATNIEPRYVHLQIGATTLALQISLVNLEPNKRLKRGETTTVRAAVTSNGVPAPGKTVNFRTADPSRATISPASSTTNAQGVAEATVRGEAKWTKSTVMVTAEVDGVSSSTPVLVPDLSILGFLILLAALLFIFMLGRSRIGNAARPAGGN